MSMHSEPISKETEKRHYRVPLAKFRKERIHISTCGKMRSVQIVQNSITSNGTLKSSTQPWKIGTTT